MSDVTHAHPNRHRKALRSALILALVGAIILAYGVTMIWLGTNNGILIAMAVAGVTTMLLAPVWYFTYMEALEPELYQHD